MDNPTPEMPCAYALHESVRGGRHLRGFSWRDMLTIQSLCYEAIINQLTRHNRMPDVYVDR